MLRHLKKVLKVILIVFIPLKIVVLIRSRQELSIVSFDLFLPFGTTSIREPSSAFYYFVLNNCSIDRVTPIIQIESMHAVLLKLISLNTFVQLVCVAVIFMSPFLLVFNNPLQVLPNSMNMCHKGLIIALITLETRSQSKLPFALFFSTRSLSYELQVNEPQ